MYRASARSRKQGLLRRLAAAMSRSSICSASRSTVATSTAWEMPGCAQVRGRLHTRSMAKRTLITIALSTVLLGSVATVSWGYRPATAMELNVIRRVVRKEWRSEARIPCPIGGSNTFHLDWAYISTIDPRYALAEVKDSGCTYTRGYFLRRPSKHSERWEVVARRLDSAQSCSSFTDSVPKRVVREFSIEGTRGNAGPVGPCMTPDVIDAAHIAQTIPTTAPLDATGPEDPEGGVYGFVHPRKFILAAVPVSFGFETHNARWRNWGSREAIGTGTAEFNVIMSPPQRVTFTLTLSGRRLITCSSGDNHYSYEKVTIHIPNYEGEHETFSENMHPGCSHLEPGLP
jgi:hypothetical protein